MNLCFDFFFYNSASSVLLLQTLVGSSSGWLSPKSHVTKMWQNIIFITLIQIVLPALEFDNFFKPAKVLIKHFSKQKNYSKLVSRLLYSSHTLSNANPRKLKNESFFFPIVFPICSVNISSPASVMALFELSHCKDHKFPPRKR